MELEGLRRGGNRTAVVLLRPLHIAQVAAEEKVTETQGSWIQVHRC